MVSYMEIISVCLTAIFTISMQNKQDFRPSDFSTKRKLPKKSEKVLSLTTKVQTTMLLREFVFAMGTNQTTSVVCIFSLEGGKRNTKAPL